MLFVMAFHSSNPRSISQILAQRPHRVLVNHIKCFNESFAGGLEDGEQSECLRV